MSSRNKATITVEKQEIEVTITDCSKSVPTTSKNKNNKATEQFLHKHTFDYSDYWEVEKILAVGTQYEAKMDLTFYHVKLQWKQISNNLLKGRK